MSEQPEVGEFGHTQPPTFNHPNTHDGELDVREWRVIKGAERVQVWAVNPDGSSSVLMSLSEPFAKAVRTAEQIVREHAMLSAPYADDEHRGGHWLNILPQRPRWAP